MSTESSCATDALTIAVDLDNYTILERLTISLLPPPIFSSYASFDASRC